MARPEAPPAGGPAPAAPRAPAIEARGAGFRFPGRQGREVLQGVDLAVQQGSAVALLGPSGSGKTTLLRVLAGLLPATEGEVVLRLPREAPPDEHRRAGRVGYIPQHLGLVRPRRVLDNVLTGALARAPRGASLLGEFPAAEVDAAHAALEAVGLAGKARERTHRLSGGERQRVAIARALLQRPALLLADEFVSNLDVANAAAVLGLVQGLRRQGTTVVMALHDLGLAQAQADELVVLHEGRVAARRPASAPAEEVRWLLGA